MGENIPEEQDGTSDAMQIEKGKIRMSVNPFKLFKAVAKNTNNQWFGDRVAENFQKQKTEL